jgi:four helix bundle protein
MSFPMKRDLSGRLRKFAVRILRLVEVLRKIPGAKKIADQLERCAPSIGHNYAEAQAASSLAHFISIIEICEREARETQFALGVVIDSQFVKPSRLRDLDQESGEIVAIMTTIGKRAKQRKKQQMAPNKNR